MSVGLDSIATVEFTNAVSDELGVGVSAMMLFDHPTLDSIASYLGSELEPEVTTNVQMASAVEGSAVRGSPANGQVLFCIMAACF